MMQKIFHGQTLIKNNIWLYKMFKENEERPSTSADEERVSQIKQLVLANRQLTIRGLADDVNISKGSVNNYFKGVLSLTRQISIDTENIGFLYVCFTPKMPQISFHNHRIRLIYLRVTSDYLLNSKDCSENIVLCRLWI